MAKDEKAKVNGEEASPKARRPGLDRSVQTHIGRKLKAIYHSFAAEPVPDRITELLQKLEAEERMAAQPGGAPDAPEATIAPGSATESGSKE